MLPTQDLLRTEFVYRSHRRELRERVARGQDTRPGTAAKLVIARSHNGQLAPLTTAGAGLCMRMWARASRTVPRSTTPTSASTTTKPARAIGGNRSKHRQHLVDPDSSRP